VKDTCGVVFIMSEDDSGSSVASGDESKKTEPEMPDDGEDGGDDSISEDDDEEPETNQEAGRGKRKLEAFAAAMANVLAPSHTKKVPALSKAKAKELKEMANEKTHGRKEEDRKAAKRRLLDKDLVEPTHLTATFEKTLRKTATRGVVALFNAIKTHQRNAGGKARESSSKANDKRMSKEKFLQMLQKQGTSSTKSGTDRRKASKQQKIETNKEAKQTEAGEMQADKGGKAGWDVLQDDMLLGATMRDWDKIDTNAEKAKKKTRNTFEEGINESALWADDDDDDEDDGSDFDGDD